MDETEAWQVQRRASAYSIINNELVKHSSTGVFQRCIEQDKGIEILLDIHQGECGHHAASRSLVAKAFHHARPIRKLDGRTAVRFVKDIAVRYGMPNSIIMDNGTNFAKGALAQYCSVSGIHLDLASVAHPRSNGQGPFIVSKALRDRNAYCLIDARKSNKRKRDTASEETTRPWNAELLRLFYS
ncbi:uncharacterized protein [Aegilops tauschii subsp. strangulata]|uniref:uncharacterized protein n=1 Tax=Aegilops tauschii subsp. strangulata TaxID=200361 RepID=UPI003CC88449